MRLELFFCHAVVNGSQEINACSSGKLILEDLSENARSRSGLSFLVSDYYFLSASSVQHIYTFQLSLTVGHSSFTSPVLLMYI